jgi:hypothetical protein
LGYQNTELYLALVAQHLKFSTTDTNARLWERELYHSCLRTSAEYFETTETICLMLLVVCSCGKILVVHVGQVEYKPISDFLVPRFSVYRDFIGMNVQFFVGICGTPVTVSADRIAH